MMVLDTEGLIREKLELERENAALKKENERLRIQLNEARRYAGYPRDNRQTPAQNQQPKTNPIAWMLANKKRIYLGIFALVIIIGLIRIVISL